MVKDKRILLVGAVSLVRGRLKNGGQALLAARNEIEPELRKHEYLKNAPFQTISVILRYGEIEDLNPEIGGIDKKNSELPVAVTLNFKELESLELGELISRMRMVMIEILCDVAANYDLPFEFLDAMRTWKPGKK